MSKPIPLTLPNFGQAELTAIQELLTSPEQILAEKYTKLCRNLLTQYYQAETLLTHSCTAALEMAALLHDIQAGDEVIIPSFTFVSTATAFVLYGAIPVFVDCDPDTLNIDPLKIAAAITPKTKAIVVMHYAGIACDMPAIQAIASEHKLAIIEDAAQCIAAKFQDRHLGTLGTLGAISFHNTKNITSGLGGALIINDEALLARAKIIWQKGTNREAFIEGQVDKYTWQDLGSSFMINEIGAAILQGQLQRLDEITFNRITTWNRYHDRLVSFENKRGFRRPIVPKDCQHNAHIYFLIAPSEQEASLFKQYLNRHGISASSHYVPLHLAPAGRRFSNQTQSLPVCEALYQRIVRLPLWEGMSDQVDYILDTINRY